MKKVATIRSVLMGSAIALAASSADAGSFNIPGGTLAAALDAYSAQSGVQIAISSDNLHGIRTNGVSGDMSSEAALSRLLSGTGFAARKVGNSIAVVRTGGEHSENVSDSIAPIQMAQAAAPSRAAVETVTVTSSKLGGADVQSIPIAITALSQEQLTATQTAGGPDLVKQVPNLTFTKTNFTGYSIQIRGIGTQAISVTTDPAVAVALNDIPFIRNHFFEQEFYDLSQAEVLRGPQGTLYGRNATAGVVNLITAKPTDQFEAMASADIGNYKNRRFEGMVNIPIVDDRLDLRIAGEWTKRDGYSFNDITNAPIDGRDLWSSRVTLGWKPSTKLQATLVWEHFQENDDRMRTAKQLCKTAPIPDSVDGVSVPTSAGGTRSARSYLSQGCEMTSLYSPDAFEVPNPETLAYYTGINRGNYPIRTDFNVYGTVVQSSNLRDISSQLDPTYKAKNDTLELNADYAVTPSLTFTSQTGYNNDFLSSTEDYNRFNSVPGAFIYDPEKFPSTVSNVILPDPNGPVIDGEPSGIFCDPQLGCSDRIVLEDLSDETAWQFSQEFRLTSNFSGPLNFSFGGNFLHYETEENYYVFVNTLSMLTADNQWIFHNAPGNGRTWVPGVSDNSWCLPGGYQYIVPANLNLLSCSYIDPNPITSLNNEGHQYFLSQNPYVLNSYAGFGEAYYTVTHDLKLTGGLRWTDDQKHFTDIPSELLEPGWGYAVTNVVNQQWEQWTGRAAIDWTPKLDFTDQTLVYGSYAHGYKAGGANPPGALFPAIGALQSSTNQVTDPIHPLTFKPEFIDAFELGSKNTLLDGALTLNGDVFYYDYKSYQISEIEDRTAINLNFNATVKGAELEAMWEPVPGLKFNFSGGYEDATLAKGSQAVDLMDRTAGNPGWMVVKPFPTNASNCILPLYVVAARLQATGSGNADSFVESLCSSAYNAHEDPLTCLQYVAPPVAINSDECPNAAPPAGYSGFDPLAGTPGDPYTGQNKDNYLGTDVGPAPNNGEGFDKNIAGNQLPNAPHFTASFSGEYTLPVSGDWAATFHGDFYWQSQQWARVFNDPIDKIQPYSTTNLALILTSAGGWQVIGYVKNVFDVTAITGTFLNSDDTGLTTNVFLTDPRLYGVRVTKNW